MKHQRIVLAIVLIAAVAVSAVTLLSPRRRPVNVKFRHDRPYQNTNDAFRFVSAQAKVTQWNGGDPLQNLARRIRGQGAIPTEALLTVTAGVSNVSDKTDICLVSLSFQDPDGFEVLTMQTTGDDRLVCPNSAETIQWSQWIPGGDVRRLSSATIHLSGRQDLERILKNHEENEVAGPEN